MSIVQDWSSATFKGRILLLDGNPATKARVTIIPNVAGEITTAGSDAVILPTAIEVGVDAAGMFSVSLPATDDPDTNPTDFTYKVVVNYGAAGVPQRFFNMAAASDATIDLKTVTPVSAALGVAITKGEKGDPGPAGPAGPAGGDGGASQAFRASSFGVSKLAADNTMSLLSILDDTEIQAACAAGPTIVWLPAGEIKGHLVYSLDNLIWGLDGTTLVPPTSGPTRHMLGPADQSWIDQGGSNGPIGAGLIGYGRIDGRRDAAGSPGLLPRAPTATVTVLGTGGTLVAGSYRYVLRYKSTWGLGAVGDPGALAVSVPADGSVQLDWANPAGAAGAQIVVYGRDEFDVGAQKPLATLPPGTTQWVDTGSSIPTGMAWTHADHSAPSCIAIGQKWMIAGDIELRDMPGTGFSSQYVGANPLPWYAPMESTVTGLRIAGCNGPGFVWHGTHDSIVENITVSGVGADRDAFVLSGNGPLVMSKVHTWGASRRAMAIYQPAEITDCQLEGGAVVGLDIQHHRVKVNGGNVFYPASSSAKGVMVGSPTFKPQCEIRGLTLGAHSKYSSASGPAIDLTNAAAGSIVHASVWQDTGTVLVGGNPATMDLDIRVRGAASAQSVLPPSGGGIVVRFEKPGPIALGQVGWQWTNDTGRALSIVSARVEVGTAGAGGWAVWDVNLNGITIFTNPTNRPAINTGGTSDVRKNMDVKTVPIGGVLTVMCKGVNPTPAVDVYVTVTLSM